MFHIAYSQQSLRSADIARAVFLRTVVIKFATPQHKFKDTVILFLPFDFWHFGRK